MDLIHIAEASSVPKTNGKKVKIMNTFPLVRNEVSQMNSMFQILIDNRDRSGSYYISWR